MGKKNRGRRNNGSNDNEGSNQKKRLRENDDSNPSKKYERERDSDGELVVYRILCPNDLIGSVIGKGGKVVGSLRQETRAWIKIVNPFPGADHRVITIYCYVNDTDKEVGDFEEDAEKPLCPAQDALFKVHATITAAKAKKKEEEEVLMLVPCSQAAKIVGKGGSTVERLRAKTSANIKVNQKNPKDSTQSCAMSFDNFVVISGDAQAVRKALFAVSAIMYKYSPPKEPISLEITVPEISSSIIVPSDVPIYPAGSFYAGAEAVVAHGSSLPPVISSMSQVPERHGYSDMVGAWPAYPSSLPVVSGYGAPSHSEELVIRLLCPSDRIGHVIGKGGSSIINVRQASGADIGIDDNKHGGKECIIKVTSRESSDDVKSAAVEAVLLLQEKINDDYEDKGNIRLLVPSKVAGCLIGKGGSIINEMRKNTKADVQVAKGEIPKCASLDDELVEVSGKVAHVRDALLQIIIRLRDYVLRDTDSGQNAPPAEPGYSVGVAVPPVFPSEVEAGSGLGMLSGGSLYGYGSLQGGDNVNESLCSYSSQPYGGLPSYEIVIPANAINKVMGKGGGNLANIRKISGATIDIVKSKSSWSEHIAQISGTQDQRRSAESLIHAFILST